MRSATAAISLCCIPTKASCRSDGGVVELELYRLRDSARRRLRDLLDEPPAEYRERQAAVRHPQSAAAAARGDAAPQRGLRSSDLRRERHRRATQAVAAAGQTEYLVLRRLFRRGLSRGRLAGRTRGRRATRRRATSLAGAERVRAVSSLRPERQDAKEPELQT